MELLNQVEVNIFYLIYFDRENRLIDFCLLNENETISTLITGILIVLLIFTNT